MIAGLLLAALALAPVGFESDAECARCLLGEGASWEAPLVWREATMAVASGNARSVEVTFAAPGTTAVWFSEVTVSSEPGAEGAGAEVRLDPGATRRRSFRCEPRTEVTLRCLIAADAPGALASLSLQPAGGEPVSTEWGELPCAPSRLGRRIARLQPGGRLSLAYATAPTRLGLSLDIRGGPGAALAVRLREGEGLELVERLEPGAAWQRARAVPVLRGSPSPCWLTLEAVGESPVDLDNLELGDLAPRVGEVSWREGDPFTPRGPLSVLLDAGFPIAPPFDPIRAFADALMRGNDAAGAPADASLTYVPTLAPDAYRVEVDGGSVRAFASDTRGARHALLALRELAASTAEGSGGVLPPLEATGAPVLPCRAVALDSDDADLRALSELRITHIALASRPDETFRSQLLRERALADRARAEALAVVPTLRVWGTSVLEEYPRLAEGARIEETLRLDADGRAALSAPCPLIGPGRPVLARSLRTGRPLAERRDWLLQAGTLSFVPGRGFADGGQAWLLEAIPGSGLRPGDQVRVTYDAAEPNRPETPLCPAQAQTDAILSRLLGRLVEATGADTVRLDLGPTEPRGEDAACRESDHTGPVLMRARVRALSLAAGRREPPVRLLLPLDHAARGARDPARPLVGLPSTAVVLIEAGGDPPAAHGAALAALAAEPSRAWLVAVADGDGTLAAWAQEAAVARGRGAQALGLVAVAGLGRPAPALEVALLGWSPTAAGPR